VRVVSVDWEVWAFLAAGALVFAAPTEYLCHRWGWGLGIRLLTWAAGATLIGGLLALGASSEEMCSALDREWAGNCDDLKRVYASVLPILAALSLALWSVLYATAATVCRSIYRLVLT
jgi:hypothetical protein